MQRTRLSVPTLPAGIAFSAFTAALAQQVVQPNAGAVEAWRLIGQTHANHQWEQIACNA